MELLDFIVSYSSVCLSYKPATPSRQGPASFLFVWQIVGSQEMFGGGWRVGGWVMRGESAVPQSRGPCSAEDRTPSAQRRAEMPGGPRAAAVVGFPCQMRVANKST